MVAALIADAEADLELEGSAEAVAEWKALPPACREMLRETGVRRGHGVHSAVRREVDLASGARDMRRASHAAPRDGLRASGPHTVQFRGLAGVWLSLGFSRADRDIWRYKSTVRV